MAAQFGILTTNKTPLTAIMIIQSWSVTDEIQTAEAIAEDGTIELIKSYGAGKKFSCEGIVQDTLPTPGDTLTVDTVVYQVRSVEVTEENEAWKKVSIEGVYKYWT